VANTKSPFVTDLEKATPNLSNVRRFGGRKRVLLEQYEKPAGVAPGDTHELMVVDAHWVPLGMFYWATAAASDTADLGIWSWNPKSDPGTLGKDDRLIDALNLTVSNVSPINVMGIGVNSMKPEDYGEAFWEIADQSEPGRGTEYVIVLKYVTTGGIATRLNFALEYTAGD